VNLEITHHTDNNRTLLQFDRPLGEDLVAHLYQLGFRADSKILSLWSAAGHPAYTAYVKDLQKALEKGRSWKHISITPSFKASLEHIIAGKYFIVSYILKNKKGKTSQEDFIVFDTYKAIVGYIADRYGVDTYGEKLKEIHLKRRPLRSEARALFNGGRILPKEIKIPKKQESIVNTQNPDYNKQITNSKSQKSQSQIPKIINQKPTSKAQNPQSKLQKTKNQLPKPNQKGPLAHPHSEKEPRMDTLNDIKLRRLVDRILMVLEKEVAHKTLDALVQGFLEHLIVLLYKALEEDTPVRFTKGVRAAITHYRGWYDLHTTDTIHYQLTLLMESLGEPALKSLAAKEQHFALQETIVNTLVPKGSGHRFAMGQLRIQDQAILKKSHPQLYRLNSRNLRDKATARELFQLTQMAHPTDYGIAVHRWDLLSLWEEKGEALFKKLGFPIDTGYPYINIHTGYKGVYPLEKLLGNAKKTWWSVAAHYRPIANMQLALESIETLLQQVITQQQSLINPKTNKTKGKDKTQYQHLEFVKEQLSGSKEVIQGYINTTKVLKPATTTEKDLPDYIYKVIAEMEAYYTRGKRLGKRAVESLMESTGTPNPGQLWEAVELSWLLWYQRLYREALPFELRLKKMLHFWNTVQPTYAYSDSSKELYKQYSTPCLLGAIIAEYTRMQEASHIFEPSAGNGLLIMGADPKKTIVNEIDTSRRHSLKYQGFKEIHAYNAAEPFSKDWEKRFDVMVTNPPFARWEADPFDKQRWVREHFNGHQGLERYMRLEHFMAGLALKTLKDSGRAAILIMGHLYYNEQGYIAKYRPFYNWLFRHYKVDDVINLNGFTLYNRQGAVTRVMLILISGRKNTPSGVAPRLNERPELAQVMDDYLSLYRRIRPHIQGLSQIIQQLKILKNHAIL